MDGFVFLVFLLNFHPKTWMATFNVFKTHLCQGHLKSGLCSEGIKHQIM